eukprot:1006887-Pelagomonas_calceolata.AAC.2
MLQHVFFLALCKRLCLHIKMLQHVFSCTEHKAMRCPSRSNQRIVQAPWRGGEAHGNWEQIVDHTALFVFNRHLRFHCVSESSGWPVRLKMQ